MSRHDTRSTLGCLTGSIERMERCVGTRRQVLGQLQGIWEHRECVIIMLQQTNSLVCPAILRQNSQVNTHIRMLLKDILEFWCVVAWLTCIQTFQCMCLKSGMLQILLRDDHTHRLDRYHERIHLADQSGSSDHALMTPEQLKSHIACFEILS